MSEEQVTSTGKPLQAVPWADKVADNGAWFEKCADYYIGISRFYGRTRSNDSRDLKVLYDVYNAKFPADWFSAQTDPLSAKNPKHKQFPAKIRPVSILRTNLDLLMAEYPRRPFQFLVNNISDDGYSSYQEQLKKTVNNNIVKRFQLKLQQDMMAEGLLSEDGQPASEEAAQQIQERLDALELPEQIEERFRGSYKDGLAIKGQKMVKFMTGTSYFRQKLNKCFKHWLITGEVYSYKTIEHGEFVYKPVSPLMIDYDKSPEEDYIEDGEWVVYEEYRTVSDVVDSYYDELKKENIDKLETTTIYNSPTHLYDHLSSTLETSRGNKVRVLHVTWKGKKKWGVLTRLDPMTGEPQQIEVDEDYPVDKETETVEWFWGNEFYETTKISHDLHVRKRAIPFQRNSLTNFSKTKGPYNGRKMSDTHSQNVSVLEIGLPIQIMYIIVTYNLERTIARSKGKIALIDKNAIPTGDGWDEETFFYYSEALGYACLDRNQVGVDKSFNQYQVLDLTCFDQIKQLIEYQQHLKQEWDDLIGINRQRKGQTYAADLVGVNERATFQSTVMTDMIFNLFEEWVERELQGILDLSKYLAVDGVAKLLNNTDLGMELLEIEPTSYCNASLGLMMENAADAIAKKNKMESYATQMLQNKVKPSTIFKILNSDNMAELHSMLIHIEEMEAKALQSQSQSEQEAQAAETERVQAFETFRELLKRATMHEEYDRKEDLEEIKGTYNTFTFQDGDANDNGVPDAAEAAKILLEKEKLGLAYKAQSDKMKDAREQRNHEVKQKLIDAELKMKELQSKEKISRNKPKPKK